MTSVQIGLPNLGNIDPTILAVAKFLRRSSILKQRKGIIYYKRQDFFRGNTFIQLQLSSKLTVG